MDNRITRVEKWKSIRGYEGLYEISSMGRVRSVDRVTLTHRGLHITRGKEMKPYSDYGTHYLKVLFCKDGEKKHKYVHRLVAEAFVANDLNKPCIDHIDGNIFNNEKENLRWVTNKENNNFSLYRYRNSQSKKYVSNGNAKRVVYSCEGIYWDFMSVSLASECLGISKYLIFKSCNEGKGQFRYA